MGQYITPELIVVLLWVLVFEATAILGLVGWVSIILSARFPLPKKQGRVLTYKKFFW